MALKEGFVVNYNNINKDSYIYDRKNKGFLLMFSNKWEEYIDGLGLSLNPKEHIKAPASGKIELTILTRGKKELTFKLAIDEEGNILPNILTYKKDDINLSEDREDIAKAIVMFAEHIGVTDFTFEASNNCNAIHYDTINLVNRTDGNFKTLKNIETNLYSYNIPLTEEVKHALGEKTITPTDKPKEESPNTPTAGVVIEGVQKDAEPAPKVQPAAAEKLGSKVIAKGGRKHLSTEEAAPSKFVDTPSKELNTIEDVLADVTRQWTSYIADTIKNDEAVRENLEKAGKSDPAEYVQTKKELNNDTKGELALITTEARYIHHHVTKNADNSFTDKVTYNPEDNDKGYMSFSEAKEMVRLLHMRGYADFNVPQADERQKDMLYLAATYISLETGKDIKMYNGNEEYKPKEGSYAKHIETETIKAMDETENPKELLAKINKNANKEIYPKEVAAEEEKLQADEKAKPEGTPGDKKHNNFKIDKIDSKKNPNVLKHDPSLSDKGIPYSFLIPAMQLKQNVSDLQSLTDLFPNATNTKIVKTLEDALFSLPRKVKVIKPSDKL